MQSSIAGTFPLFRSGTALALITELYISDQELSLTQLSSRLGESKQALSKQLPPLVNSGLLKHRVESGASFYQPGRSSPFYTHLMAIIELSEAPPVVLAIELADVGGIEELHIFGSWARRKAGTTGASPNDIDIMVVGDPDQLDLAEACAHASHRLRREVNPKVISVWDWSQGTSEFLRAVQADALHRVEHTPLPKRENLKSIPAVSAWETELLG